MSVRHETYLRMRDWNKAAKELEADGPRPNRSGVSAATPTVLKTQCHTF